MGTRKADGHRGGAVISEAFWRTSAREERNVRAGLKERIEAVPAALAAQQSSATRQEVNVRELRERVFA